MTFLLGQPARRKDAELVRIGLRFGGPCRHIDGIDAVGDHAKVRTIPVRFEHIRDELRRAVDVLGTAVKVLIKIFVQIFVDAFAFLQAEMAGHVFRLYMESGRDRLMQLVSDAYRRSPERKGHQHMYDVARGNDLFQ